MSRAGVGSDARRPVQTQLLLPLLEVLAECPGGATARQACDAVAESIGLSAEQRARELVIGEARYNAFDRDVRWVRQQAVGAGLIDAPARNTWVISGKGSKALREARPGVVVTVFTDASGIVLWGAVEDAIGLISDKSVQLLLTSPPYPQLRCKQYGNLDSRSHVSWLKDVIEACLPKLKEDGSIVLNLGDVYERGRPSLDPYCERLLLRLIDDLNLKLAGRFEWQNPSKMPAPAEWVTVRRVRVKSSLERCYWLSASDHPKADNRRVLTPYSRSMKGRIAQGGERCAERPSGHAMVSGAFAQDLGGAIPGNLLVAANTQSSGAYMDYCRAHGLPIHPARFPAALPEFFIRYLTTPGDVVADIFAGSLKTAEAARDLGRRYVAIERVLEYVLGGVGGRLANGVARI
jgi:DNA modification methylase